MEKTYLKLKQYLICESEDNLSKLLESDKRIYYLILFFFKRNGIYENKFTYSDFLFHFYVVLKENNKEILILIENENDPFKIFSHISNIILKKLNREMYRKSKISEIKVGDDIDNIEDKNVPEEIDETIDENMLVDIKKYLDKYNINTRLSMEMYFGINRKYKLSVDQICNILRVKRSSTFTNITKFKEWIKNVK